MPNGSFRPRPRCRPAKSDGRNAPSRMHRSAAYAARRARCGSAGPRTFDRTKQKRRAADGAFRTGAPIRPRRSSGTTTYGRCESFRDRTAVHRSETRRPKAGCAIRETYPCTASPANGRKPPSDSARTRPRRPNRAHTPSDGTSPAESTPRRPQRKAAACRPPCGDRSRERHNTAPMHRAGAA